MDTATTVAMLTELHDVVTRVAETSMLNGKPHEFNMWVWARAEDPNEPDCGTAGCALGTFGFSEEGHARGITCEPAPGCMTPDIHFDGERPCSHGRILKGAAEKFGITRQESEYLFDPEQYYGSMRTHGLDSSSEIPMWMVLGRIATLRNQYRDMGVSQ